MCDIYSISLQSDGIMALSSCACEYTVLSMKTYSHAHNTPCLVILCWDHTLMKKALLTQWNTALFIVTIKLLELMESMELSIIKHTILNLWLNYQFTVLSCKLAICLQFIGLIRDFLKEFPSKAVIYAFVGITLQMWREARKGIMSP